MNQINHLALSGTPFFRKSIDGIGRFSVNILEVLARRNSSRQFTLIGFKGDECFQDFVPEYPHVKTHFLPISRKVYKLIFAQYGSGITQILPFVPDAILSTDFTYLPNLKVAHRFTVIHDLAFRDVPETVPWKNRTFLKWVLPKTLEQSTGVLTVSHFTQGRLRHYYSGQLDDTRLGLAPNGVDARFFSRGNIVLSDEQIVQKYSLPKRFILAVGTIEPRKNLAYLLDAYQALPKHIQDEQPLILVGKPGWGTIPDPQNSNIRFTGYVSDKDLPALYRLADMFVFPSKYEGFGIPPLEAMASGTPVVATDIPPVREFAGNTIRYVPLDNLQAFSTALVSPADRSLVDAACLKARCMTWDNSVKELEAMLGWAE